MKRLLAWLAGADQAAALRDEIRELTELRAPGTSRARRRLRALATELALAMRLAAERIGRGPEAAGGALPNEGNLMHGIMNDVRLSLRGLARTPLILSVIVLTVGVGLGATVTLFAVVDAVLLRPLPYANAGRLVRVYMAAPPHRRPLSLVDYRAVEAQQTSFDALGAYSNTSMTFSRGDVVERLLGKYVTGSYFETLGVRPRYGRVLTRADDDPGGERVAVVSYAFWQRQLGSDPAVVGAALKLDGIAYTLVGVLGPDTGPFEAGRDFFAIARWPTPTRRGPFFITAIGRLKAGVTPASATSELRTVARRTFPIWQSSFQDASASFAATPLDEFVVGGVSRPLWLSLGAVALVLLIACVNGVHLLLARGLDRRREAAVRAALGASRLQLLRWLASEGAVLGTAAAIVALAFVEAAFRWLPPVMAAYVPRAAEIGWSPHVVALVLGLVVLATIVFGLTPAVRGLGESFAALRSAGRTGTDGRSSQRLRRGLVALEVALATPVVIVAALLASSVGRLYQVDPGIDPDRLATASIALPPARYGAPDAVRTFWDRLESQIGATPGVAGVTTADSRPPSDAQNENNFNLRDHPTPDGQQQPTSPWVAVDEGFFAAAGLRLDRGRVFRTADFADNAPPVVVVDRAWEARFFHGESAIGRHMEAGGCTTCPLTTVIGVVSDVKYRGLDAPEDGTVYWPLPPDTRSRYLIVRTSGAPAGVLPAIGRVLRGIDPEVALAEVATGDELIRNSIETPRDLSAVVGAVAIVAFLLAIVGIYGVTAFFVVQQTKAIAIRVALGGRPGAIVALVMKQAVTMVLAGTAIGVVVALAAARLVQSSLFGVRATDPRILAGVPLAMVAVAAASCILPVRRAVTIDPVTVLRDA